MRQAIRTRPCPGRFDFVFDLRKRGNVVRVGMRKGQDESYKWTSSTSNWMETWSDFRYFDVILRNPLMGLFFFFFVAWAKGVFFLKVVTLRRVGEMRLNSVLSRQFKILLNINFDYYFQERYFVFWGGRREEVGVFFLAGVILDRRMISRHIELWNKRKIIINNVFT